MVDFTNNFKNNMAKKKAGEVFGQKGGLVTLKKYGKDHFRNIALKRHRKEKREKAKLEKNAQ